MIHVIYTKSYDRTLKKLKKHPKEMENLYKIIEYLKNSGDISSINN